MSKVPSNHATSLRVAVLASNEAHREALAQLVVGAGHRIATLESADVVLSDAETSSASKPTVVVNEASSDAEDHLPSDASQQQIDAALRAVVAGLSIKVKRSQRPTFEEIADSNAQNVLTPRELDVINAISSGLSNKAIARELGISLHTVKFHIESLLRKLGARTRAEAVAKAMERRRRETFEL